MYRTLGLGLDGKPGIGHEGVSLSTLFPQVLPSLCLGLPRCRAHGPVPPPKGTAGLGGSLSPQAPPHRDTEYHM